jgi:hypothetical protein
MSEQSEQADRPVDPDVAARDAGRFLAKAIPRPRSRRRRRRARIRGPPDDAAGGDLDAYSIAEFCRRHGISESFYHKLKKLGFGPRTMKLGARILITRESAAAWRRQRAAASQEAQV